MPLKANRIDSELESLPKAKAAFTEPMLLLRTGALPEAAEWLYELKLDVDRALAIKTKGRVELRSRNDNDVGLRYQTIAN
jgi:ATP-dependent DNA ligase